MRNRGQCTFKTRYLNSAEHCHSSDNVRNAHSRPVSVAGCLWATPHPTTTPDPASTRPIGRTVLRAGSSSMRMPALKGACELTARSAYCLISGGGRHSPHINKSFAGDRGQLDTQPFRFSGIYGRGPASFCPSRTASRAHWYGLVVLVRFPGRRHPYPLISPEFPKRESCTKEPREEQGKRHINTNLTIRPLAAVDDLRE